MQHMNIFSAKFALGKLECTGIHASCCYGAKTGTGLGRGHEGLLRCETKSKEGGRAEG
jgi:hypothetical protein